MHVGPQRHGHKCNTYLLVANYAQKVSDCVALLQLLGVDVRQSDAMGADSFGRSVTLLQEKG